MYREDVLLRCTTKVMLCVNYIQIIIKKRSKNKKLKKQCKDLRTEKKLYHAPSSSVKYKQCKEQLNKRVGMEVIQR